MKGTLQLGKVDAWGSGRRINAVEIEIELDDSGELHMVGAIWNGAHTDWESGGQIYDTISQLFPNDARVQRIVEIWQRWHLNHMRAGLPKQEEWLREHGRGRDYDETRARLHKAGLLVIGRSKGWKGYKYGQAWLREELPDDIRAEIVKLINSASETKAEPTYTEKNGITVKVIRSYGYRSDNHGEHYRYDLKLKRADGRITPKFTWRQGLAHTSAPTPDMVLGSLILDATSYLDASDFEDFASQFGYDINSRKAEVSARRAFDACKNTAEWLQEFLDDFEEIAYS